MISKHEEILQCVAELVAAVHGLKVWRSRPAAFDKKELPAVLIEPGQAPADYSNISFLEWDLEIKLTLLTFGGVPESEGDQLVSGIFSAIMNSARLRNMVLDIVPAGIFFSVDDGEQPIGATQFVFRTRYRTKLTTLEGMYSR